MNTEYKIGDCTFVDIDEGTCPKCGGDLKNKPMCGLCCMECDYSEISGVSDMIFKKTEL